MSEAIIALRTSKITLSAKMATTSLTSSNRNVLSALKAFIAPMMKLAARFPMKPCLVRLVLTVLQGLRQSQTVVSNTTCLSRALNPRLTVSLAKQDLHALPKLTLPHPQISVRKDTIVPQVVSKFNALSAPTVRLGLRHTLSVQWAITTTPYSRHLMQLAWLAP